MWHHGRGEFQYVEVPDWSKGFAFQYFLQSVQIQVTIWHESLVLLELVYFWRQDNQTNLSYYTIINRTVPRLFSSGSSWRVWSVNKHVTGEKPKPLTKMCKTNKHSGAALLPAQHEMFPQGAHWKGRQKSWQAEVQVLQAKFSIRPTTLCAPEALRETTCVCNGFVQRCYKPSNT